MPNVKITAKQAAATLAAAKAARRKTNAVQRRAPVEPEVVIKEVVRESPQPAPRVMREVSTKTASHGAAVRGLTAVRERHNRAASGMAAGPSRDLLLAIVNPAEHHTRCPGLGDEPTTSLAFGPTYDVDFSGAGHAGDDVMPDQCLIIKRRDSLLLDNIIWKQNLAYNTTYIAQFYNEDAQVLATTIIVDLNAIAEFQVTPVAYGFSTGDQNLHGPAFYQGCDTNGKRYALISNQGVMQMTLSAFTASTVIMATFKRTGENTEEVVDSHLMVAGTPYGYTVQETGYYRQSLYYIGGSTNESCTINNQLVIAPDTNGAWSQNSSQEVNDNFDKVNAFRINGASVLVTQAASVTNQNGRGLQVQVPAGRDILVAMKRSFHSYGQTNTRMFKPRSLYKGLYSYVKPADKTVDFAMRSEFETNNNGVLIYAAYPIISRSPMLAIYLSVPTAAGRVFTYQPGLSWEFSSDSAYAELAPSQGDDRNVDEVMRRLKGKNQHMENETHENEIAGILGTLSRVASAAAPFAGPYAPVLAGAGAVGQALFRSS